jgi:3-oxoacyl-[acyl-carrier protein] reductase
VIDLTGKTALVTGGSRGIGRAISLLLAEQGAKVAVNYRANAEAAQKVVECIAAGGGEAIAVQADVRSQDQVTDMVKEVIDAFGRLDILVNNAGLRKDTLLIRMKEEDWDLVMETNAKGTFLCTKAVQRQMMRQRWGRIINITSVSGLAGNPGQANYSAAKAALVGFTKTVAKEMASRGITCNAVAPGFVLTDLTVDLGEAMFEGIKAACPLGRLGEAREIASAVAFLASDEAAYITGQVLSVDGGLVMQ